MKEQRKSNQHWMRLCLGVLLFCTSSAWADFIFGEPVNLGTPVNTSRDESMPTISSDRLSLYFSLYDPNGSGFDDIWVSKRKSTKDAWEPGTSLGPIVNSSDLECFPFISADGLTLYFSRLNTSFTRCAIWQTTRPTVDDDWTPPVKLGAPFNSSGNNNCPCISANGLEFYFASDRHTGYSDMYVCRRASIQDAWSDPVVLDVLNSNDEEYGPSLSADGLVMFFNSWRAGGYGLSDIYMTTRKTLDAEWSPPVNIGPPVNSSYVEMASSISSDGRTLYFSGHPFFALRPGGMGGDDIWTASIDPIVDFNADGLVDCADIGIMIERWGTDDSVCDIGPMPWGDGVVDAQDLLVLAESMIETADQE